MKGGDIAQIRRVADKLSRRTSFDSRTGWGRATVDSLANVSITSLPEDRSVMPDVRGHGTQRRPLHPRKPRPEGPLHGAGGRDAAKHFRRNPHRAGDGGDVNIEMK